MKIIKTGALILIIALSFSACRKTSDPGNTSQAMKDMKVPGGFDWSGSTNYSLAVDIAGNGNGQTLRLYDKSGNLLDAQSITGNKVLFSFQLPYGTDSLRIYSPVTRLSKYIRTEVAQTDFVIGPALKSSASADFALNLNGGGNYIQVSNNGPTGIVVQYPFTFSAWFKTPGGGTENSDMVLVNIANPNTATGYYGVYLRKYAENFYKAEVKSKNGSTEYVKSTNQNVSDDTWHQVVGVFMADGTRKLYLDGIYEGMSSSVMAYNPNVLITSFGRWGDNTPDKYFHGLLDNICIWTKEFSDADAAAFYHTNPVGNEIGLVGYWKFNEGSGTAAGNSASGGGFPGVINGASWVNISVQPDADGDGVPDESDYWPQDPTRAYNTIFPSGNNYYFHLYEDLWPGYGDYDFNDIILKTKVQQYRNAQNNLVGGRVISNVYWIGGGIPRGAGIEWLKSDATASQFTYLPANAVTFTEPQNVLKDPQVSNAVMLFNNNLLESLGQTVDFGYAWNNSQGGNNPWIQVYIYLDRDHEVHTYGNPPTMAANMNLFGTVDDHSPTSWIWSPGNTFTNPTGFYRSYTNLPWGLEVVASEFWIPNEKTEILLAYPQFRAWAESGGTVNQTWYNNPDKNYCHLP
ncbi:MAG: LruC domain-containing protein [Bacteroidota bacterium]